MINGKIRSVPFNILSSVLSSGTFTPTISGGGGGGGGGGVGKCIASNTAPMT